MKRIFVPTETGSDWQHLLGWSGRNTQIVGDSTSGYKRLGKFEKEGNFNPCFPEVFEEAASRVAFFNKNF